MVGSIIDVTQLVKIGFLKLFRAARLEKFEWNILSSALCFQADKVTEEKRQCEDPGSLLAYEEKDLVIPEEDLSDSQLVAYVNAPA